LLVVVTPNRFRDLEPELSILAPLGAEVRQAQTDNEFNEWVPDASALLVTATPIDRRVISRCRSCRAIVRYGVGVEGVDVEAATQAGIPVGNVVDASIEEVADHAVTLALMLLRRLPDSASALADGEWSLTAVRGVRRLSTLTAGVVGLGRIGRAVSARLTAFGMRVIAHDPYLASDSEIELSSLDDLLPQVDLLTLHVPESAETRGLLGRARLALLPESAVLVNVSRGGIVDEEAVADLLHQGRLGGAAFDVFAAEPLPSEHPLRTAPRAVLTPHCAWFSEEASRDLQTAAARQVARALRGEPLDPVVDPAVYEQRRFSGHPRACETPLPGPGR
jgi:D-3-phosphoglycerate dehydrogenase